MSQTRKLLTALLLTLPIVACLDSPVGMDGTSVSEPNEGGSLTSVVAGDNARASAQLVDHFRHRLDIDFAAEGVLRPQAPITIRLEGVATEDITGGEVFVTLPTQASMAHVGPGTSLHYPEDKPFPVVARWTLATMSAGATWKGRFDFGAVEPGYYNVAVTIRTHGPNSNPYLLDDVYRKAWLLITENGGVITPYFDESLFADRISPQPGPFVARPRQRLGNAAQGMDMVTATGSTGSQQNITIRVVYHYRDRSSDARPAVGATFFGHLINATDPDDDYPLDSRTFTVPSSGYVTFPCPSSTTYWTGGGNLPITDEVTGGPFLGYWEATHADCGQTITIVGRDHYYLPWKNLDEAIEKMEDQTGSYRKDSRQAWEADMRHGRSSYSNGRITFGPKSYWYNWTAAHEFGHALHDHAIGGLWGVESSCREHDLHTAHGYKCGFVEGLADYLAELVWNRGDLNIEGGPFADPPDDPGEIEGNVAKMFWDLTDSSNEPGDETDYEIEDVLRVVATCRADGSQMRDVSDFVWCIEGDVNNDVHEDHFPNNGAPSSVSASRSSSFNASDIRSTWTRTVGRPQ